MACHLLKKGWTSDEVNARLGHKPSSQELDKYINFLALDRHTPKKKLNDGQLQQLLEEVKDLKDRDKLNNLRVGEQSKDIAYLKQQIKKDREHFIKELKSFSQILEELDK